MLKACCLIREAPHYRADAFRRGLTAAGLSLVSDAGACDVLVIWNRYGANERLADQVEARGGRVLVAENAAWGNDFVGGRWYSLALGVNNTAGRFRVGDSHRWDSIGVGLAPWRRTAGEIVILPQRGIGPRGVAMPSGWPEAVKRETGGRIRPHPGKYDSTPLRDDLALARQVVTWGSGAAIKALLWGIPVRSDMPGWVGEQDNTDGGRLAMFRRLAWGQWRVTEISCGDAFRWLL